MDSPPDLSPNAPPAAGDHPADYFASLQGQEIRGDDRANPDGVASSNDSVDSSGFEKVDPNSDDLLADYSANFHNQMQQSLYGQLPEDPTARAFDSISDESSFEVVDPREIQVLTPTFSDIDEPRRRHLPDDMDPHGAEVLEKSYGDISHNVDDLIGDLAEHEGAQAIAKAVEEAPKAVDDFLRGESPREVPVDVPSEAPHDFLDDIPVKPSHLPADIPKAADDLEAFLQGDVHHDSPVSPSDSGRDTVGRLIGEASDEDEAPAFGAQTPEETTFERQGPLTIPTDLIEQPEEEEAVHDPAPAPLSPHHGFDTVARPPTPPKDISDEDVKPTAVQLGHHVARGPWFDFKTVDPKVLDLIYWRDPKKSGIALAAILATLFVFTRFPLITVLSYAGLAALAGTLGFRLLKAAQAQINKTDAANPFQPYLEQDLAVPQERVHEQVDVLVEHGQCLARQLRRLFLVENIVDSVKFGLLLWSFTYIGAWFSGVTLIFLAVIAIFSVPKIYETYQEPIDANLAIVKGHIDNVSNTLEEKLPFLKKAAVVEKKEQ